MVGGLAHRRRNSIEDDLPKDFVNNLKQIGYVFESKIGEGSYSNVYRCHLVDQNGVAGDKMAVKHINLSRDYKPKYRHPETIAELELIEEKSKRKEQLIKTSVWRRFKARLGLGSRKHFKIEETPESDLILTGEMVENELKALFRTNNPNVVSMYNELTYEDSRFGSRNPNPMHILIFTELAQRDLSNFKFRNNAIISANEAKDFSAQIIRGLAHLHSQGIAHLDLKSKNILVFYDPNNPNDVTLKITDFGLALLYPFDRSGESSDSIPFRCGTTCFADPLLLRTEFHLSQNPDTDVTDIDFYKADVWSYGCIVLTFFTGFDRYYDLFNSNYSFIINPDFKLGDVYIRELKSKISSQDVISFLSDILCCDQTNRKSAFECGGHVWLKDELAGLKRRTPSQRQLLETDL